MPSQNSQAIADELRTIENENMRLLALRQRPQLQSGAEQITAVSEEMDTNVSQLDKARQSVSQVIWFFNNQELSTRALEKQDPEAFNHWFASAKQEWENFSYNKAAPFKAPDQPRNTVLEKTFKSEEPSPNYFSYLLTLLPVFSSSSSSILSSRVR